VHQKLLQEWIFYLALLVVNSPKLTADSQI